MLQKEHRRVRSPYGTSRKPEKTRDQAKERDLRPLVPTQEEAPRSPTNQERQRPVTPGKREGSGSSAGRPGRWLRGRGPRPQGRGLAGPRAPGRAAPARCAEGPGPTFSATSWGAWLLSLELLSGSLGSFHVFSESPL